MIDTGDLTMYCHWDKGLVCKKEFYCDTCEHQPAANDKENGKAEPVHIRWTEDYWNGRYPECPSCGNMPYSADVVAFLPDYNQSRGARLEWEWCQYVSKTTMSLEQMTFYRRDPCSAQMTSTPSQRPTEPANR